MKSYNKNRPISRAIFGGSEGGDRTHGQEITFVFLFPKRMDYIFFSERSEALRIELSSTLLPFGIVSEPYQLSWSWLLITRIIRKRSWGFQQFTSSFNQCRHWKLRNASMNFSVTVCANEDAFFNFGLYL